jgi:hypothetical protein
MVENRSDRPVILKNSETRETVTIPARSRRGVFPAFLANSPSSIIEVYKIEPPAPVEDPEVPIVAAHPKAAASTPKDTEPKQQSIKIPDVTVESDDAAEKDPDNN